MYIIRILIDKNGYELDSRAIEDDEGLLGFIGRFAVWYFLAIDAIDYKDAYSNGDCAKDAILAFTCSKEDDKPEGPHRHGMPKGVLARGKCWYWGSSRVGSPCTLIIEKAEEALGA